MIKFEYDIVHVNFKVDSHHASPLFLEISSRRDAPIEVAKRHKKSIRRIKRAEARGSECLPFHLL